jgi:hypothetical protein
MSSGQPHNGRVRVLVMEDHVARANRIGEGLRDGLPSRILMLTALTGVSYRL